LLLKYEEKAETKKNAHIGPNNIVRPRTRVRVESSGLNPLFIIDMNLARERHHR
jgi:hypothetical protein